MSTLQDCFKNERAQHVSVSSTEQVLRVLWLLFKQVYKTDDQFSSVPVLRHVGLFTTP